MNQNRYSYASHDFNMPSRFIDELPEEYVNKSNNFIEETSEDFEFNQDIEFGEEARSPGWLRYQKKLNDK